MCRDKLRRCLIANRRFQRLQSLEREVKKLHVKVTTDGSGDVSSIEGLGVTSVSHSSDQYTITLDDKYVSFWGASAISGVAADFIVVSEDVDGAKTVVLDASVTQASTVIYVELTLKNSNVR